MTFLLDLCSGWAGCLRPAKPRRYRHILRTGLLVLLSTATLSALATPNKAEPSSQANTTRQALVSAFLESDQPFHGAVAEMLSRGVGPRVQFEGVLESYYEDYEEPGKSRFRQYLVTESGHRVELLLPEEAVQVHFGETVSAEGFLLDGDGLGLTYEALATDPEGVAPSGDGSTAPLTATTGNQNTLIILVNFIDDNSQPFTPQQAADVVLGTSSDFLYENSSGLTSLTGVAYGWYTVDSSVTVCDSENLMVLADQAVAADGLDPGSFDRVVYVHPQSVACGWAGLASLGGSPSRVLLNGTLDEHVATHEIGHTLGLQHAHAWDCGADAWGESCSYEEYGDSLENMGNRFAHYNGFHKEQLGWLPEGAVVTANASGVYELEPYAVASTGTAKVIKIPRGTDPSTGEADWLYVEFRQPAGFDEIILKEYGYDTDNILNGVIVREASEASTNSSYLLDMTPDSAGIWDFFDPALKVGQSFIDPLSGVQISTEYVDAGKARVYVDLAGMTDSCISAEPHVNLDPVGADVSAPGESLQYRLTVTNLDSSACTSAVFDLSTTVPIGWVANLAATSIELAPGVSGAVDMTVSTSPTANDGAYVIEANALQQASGEGANGTATYTVLSVNPEPINTAPLAVSDTATTPEKTDVVIPVLANDSDPDGDALTVIAVSQPSKGSVILNSDGSLTYAPPRKFSGTVAFSYTISDGALQAMAQVQVTVGSSSGGGDTTTGGGKGGGKGGKKR